MANDKRFVVKNGLQTQNILFRSAAGDEITLTLSNSDILAFAGDNGDLLTLTDTNSGTVFEVTSIEADADGTVRLCTSIGNVLIGTSTDDGTNKLQVNGSISATGGTSTEWNTAYGWGNHATQGYATTTYVDTELASLIDSAPGALDTLNELAAALGDDPNFATTVNTALANRLRVDTAAQGLTTTEQTNALTNLGINSDIPNWDTAYSWGDHSTVGYLTGNQTITLSGDVSGSGTTSIAVTVADDSHSHTTSTITNFTENVQDIVGGMVSTNTENGISVTYQDTDGTLDFDVNDFTITLTGAVTGSGTVTNLGNVSISTTATSDPTLTLTGDVTGSATFTNLGNTTLTAVVADDSHNHIISNVDGLQAALDAKADDTTTISAGTGLTGGGSLGANRTISHADTSSQASVNNSGNTFIQDITLDGFGHITAISSGTASFTDTNTTYTIDGSTNGANDINLELIAGGSGSGTDSIQIVGGGATTVSWDDVQQKISIISTDTNTDTTYSAGSGLTLAGTVFSHADTSSQGSVNNSAGTVIQDIGLDTYGHLTSLTSVNLDGRYFTETEINNFFAGTTAKTGYNKTNWDTAYGWGNHASAGYLAASSYTAADVLSKLLTVDGPGSGLNADLLDGQQGSYYLDWANVTNKPDPTITLAGDASGSVTLTDLGNGTLTVAVANDSHTHDGRYYTETEADALFVSTSGDTITGDLTITGTTTIDSQADFLSPDGNSTISVNMLDGGTLSFSGTSGQLFSITDSLTGTIFSVNDISGVPSIEVDDDGTIRFAEFAGNVLIGTATDNGTDTLQVNGTIADATGTSADWNTAYGWGDHATEGYLKSVAFSDIQAGSVLLSSENFSDVDTQLMSAAAINDLIESKDYITSQTDSQTLSWDGVNGVLSISGGNNVDLDGRYLQSFTETDPTVPSHVKGITTTNISNWNTAYNDKINSASFATGTGILTLTQQDEGTVTVDLDGRYELAGTNDNYGGWTLLTNGTSRGSITSGENVNIAAGSNVSIAYSTTNNTITINSTDTNSVDYINAASFDTDTGVLTLSGVGSAGSTVNLDGRYLQSFTETDPTVPSHVKGITTTNISNWNTAYNDKINSASFATGTGVLTLTQQDGGTVTVDLDGRYLQSLTETDPTVPSHVKSITTTNISNWNTAYNDKINSASFSTSTGILTLTQQDEGTVTVDLDGRYLQSESDTLDSVTDRGATTTNAITVGSLTSSGNVVVQGNLTVSGTTTTVNSETLTIADNIVTLNSNYTGSSPTENAGIEVERGTLTNAVLQWNEANDYWEIASGGTTGRILTVSDEGSGNGLDSDTLDGQHGSYYLNWANVTNKPDPTIILQGDATGSVTLTDLEDGTITVVVTNDSHTHDTRYYTESESDARFVNTAGDTMSGNLSINAGLSSNYLILANSETNDYTPENGMVIYDQAGTNCLNVYNSNLTRWVRIWDDSNDGTGSGLDADLLDGQHASAFATSTQGSKADAAFEWGDHAEANYIEGVTAGSGLTGGGSSGTVTISHADTSSQASVNNSNGTVIQDITLDTYGHLTAIDSVNLDSRYYTKSESDNRYLPISYTESDTLSTVTSRGTTTTANITVGGLHVNSTGAIELPTGTVAQRPTPVSGMFRFNTDDNVFEGYDGTEWGEIGGSSPGISDSADAVAIYITSAENVGIGDATPSYKLEVNGTFGATSITETSSERYKENIHPLYDYNVVSELKPVRYDRKDGSVKGEVGFIAEEVEKVDKTLVAYNKEGQVDGVHYTRIIPHLVAKIQKLEKRLAKLEK